MSELAELIVGVATLITSLGIFVGIVFNIRKTTEVKDEVKTANSQTLAQLADAVEGRRIGKIPKKNRTRLETSHMDDIK